MPYTRSAVVGLKVYEAVPESGLVLIGSLTTAPAATADVYAKGAIVVDTTTGLVYENVGTSAVPAWQLSTGASSDSNVVSAVSNGTTAVSVFGAAGLPYAITITGVYLIARDTTATNITVEAPAATVVCTIAKGATAGALVGAASLANTSVPAGTDVILDGSSTGIAQVFITYKRA